MTESAEAAAPGLAIRRLLFVTDTWEPQINGVVQTLKHLIRELERMGVAVAMISPEGYRTLPLPSYPEIRLALTTPGGLRRRIAALKPDHVHIVTEGPLGVLARRACLKAGLPFSTSYHTRFPEYVSARFPVPERLTYRWLARFHNSGGATLVGTPSLLSELRERGFSKLRLWGRGVDTDAFHPGLRRDLGLERPVFLYVGRVAVEKNLPAFLALDLPGTKLVVGDGPDLASLREKFPEAVFAGPRRGEDLAMHFASSDVFVFPSRTDTFGLVLLEALASGVPVAAYPATGPRDVFADGVGGVLSEDLREAALRALEFDRESCREKALGFGWEACARDFMAILEQAQAEALRGS